MAEEWTNATDGSVGVYPGETGLVGTPNAAGNWAMWVPRPGVTYSASYWGRQLAVANNGDGTYTMTANGATRRYRYAYRWESGKFYDAAGNVIASPDLANVAGTPSQVYFQPGYTETGSGAQAVSLPVSQPVTQPPIPTVHQNSQQETRSQPTQGNAVTLPAQRATGAPDPNTTRTRSSDGRTDVYAGDSGLVGIFNPQTNAWAIFVPQPGIDYVSTYWGGDIALRNNGDGTYWLDADGIKAKRMYNGRWAAGVFYDRNGRQLASAADARATGDPADIFFMPGSVVPDTPVTQGNTTAPVTAQPALPVLPVNAPHAGVLPDPSTYTSTGPTGVGPGTAPFPTDPITSPDGGAGGGIDGKMLALAAAAAFVLLS